MTETTSLTTVSGKFYVGMTRQDAQSKNLYNSTFSRAFTDIDKDGNGVLSEREICDERDLECSRGKIRGAISAVAGFTTALVAAAGAPLSAGLSLGEAGIAVAYAGLAMKNVKDAMSETEITDKYRQEHHLYTEG